MTTDTKHLAVTAMGNDGIFSSNLNCLKLQLQTLLEDSGGDRLVPLLDALCTLSTTEQNVVLKVFTQIINKLVTQRPRTLTDGELALKQFEESLYKEIIETLETEVKAKRPQLEVLSGRKTSRRKVHSRASLALAQPSKTSGTQLVN